MLYHFELQMAGVILLTAMASCGIVMWLRRKRLQRETGAAGNDDIYGP